MSSDALTPTDAGIGPTRSAETQRSPRPPADPFWRAAKKLALTVANQTGFSRAVATSKWRQRRLLVLCYHGVSQDDEHEWSNLYISPERLEQRIERLRKLSAEVLPLGSAIEQLYSGELPPTSVALTFDDGVTDFALNVVPRLALANMHSTYYLTTHYCRRDMPVFNPFASYLLWKGRGKTVRLPGLETRVTIPSSTDDKAFSSLHARLLKYVADASMTSEEKNEFARALANAVGADFAALCARRILHLMTPAQVRSLDSDLVSVQLHTHRHRTPTSFGELKAELQRNASEIADMTGRSDQLSHFSYPSGVHSPQLVHWLGLLGLKSATTCVADYSNVRTPRFEIPRFVDTMGVSRDAFDAWVMGSAAVTVRVRRLMAEKPKR